MHLKHATPQLFVQPLLCLCVALLEVSAFNGALGQLVPWEVPGIILEIKLCS